MNSQTLLTFPRIFKIPNNAINYHGFLLWRHNSGEATCLAYKAANGFQNVIAIKDAKFRTVVKFGTYRTNSPLINFPSANKYGNWFFNQEGTAISDQQPVPDWLTQDSVYEAWSPTLVFDRTAKENCDVWMTYQGIADSEGFVGVPAVEWCRNQKLQNKACDLPNEYQTICIWVCSDKLDELDPTASSYTDLKLGYSATGWRPYGRCQRANGLQSCNFYSSTEYSQFSVRDVFYNGNCGYSGYSYKRIQGTVIPILEL